MMFPFNPILENIYTKFVIHISRKQTINQLKVRILQIYKVYEPKYEQFEMKIWKLDGAQQQQLLINNVKRLEYSPQYRSKLARSSQKIKIKGKILNPTLLIQQSQILPQDTLFIEVKQKNSISIFQPNIPQTKRVLPSNLQNGNHKEQTKMGQPQEGQSYIDYSFMGIDMRNTFNKYSGKNGLKNIGNTCFLASALQCLSNTQLLTKYFLSRQFLRSLNKSNKLGTGGHLAGAYYNLLIQLWTQRGSIAPWDVKKQVARKARQFAGYNQQDSSQFLNILIDTLHQDMNLVKVKPYIQYKDSDGRPDDVVSLQYWNNFLSRNKSIMVELMYGQLKSKLKCLVCNRISNTFDPFAILSVPIPINLNIQFNYFTKSRELVNLKAVINDRTSFLELAQQFINFDQLLKVQDPSHIMALAIANGKIVKIFDIDNTIYGQKQLLQKVDLVYYDVGVPYSELLSQKGFQIIQIRTKVQGSQTRIFPKLLIVDPSKYTLKDLKILIFNQSFDFMEDYLFSGGAQRVLDYSQVFNESDEPHQTGFYRLGIAQTLQKISSYFRKTYYSCELTGQKIFDLQLGVQLNRLNSEFKLQQLIDTIRKKVTLTKRLVINCVWPAKQKVLKQEMIKNPKFVHQYNFQPPKSQGKSDLSLQSCLSAFRSQQILDGQDKWYCSKCKEHQKAIKKMDLFKLPKILIIQLKRFKQKGRSSYFWGPTCEKNSKHISFPTENLDLSEYILKGSTHHGNKKQSLYDLYGVVHHMGSLYGGHYIATALNFLDNQWYTYDDSCVSSIRGKSEVVSNTAYVLFYKRKDINLEE